MLFVSDDPASSAYTELTGDYNRFTSAILLANFGRPFGSSSHFALKKKERSCKNRCNEIRNDAHFCHCDRLCSLYRDCCYDYWPR